MDAYTAKPSSMEQGAQTIRSQRPGVSGGMVARSAAGFLIGKARLGYRGLRTRDGTRAVPDPEVAPASREAFGMAAAGASLRDVCSWLRGRGIKGGLGEPVSLSTVQRALTDPL